MTDYNVKLSQSPRYKVSTSTIIQIMPQNLNELADVEISGNNYDKYVLMYDSVTGKWKDVNPDNVLSAATVEPDENRTTYTLPADFENKLDVDLDNRINLDAGTF
jgi:hypothetical protein